MVKKGRGVGRDHAARAERVQRLNFGTMAQDALLGHGDRVPPVQPPPPLNNPNCNFDALPECCPSRLPYVCAAISWTAAGCDGFRCPAPTQTMKSSRRFLPAATAAFVSLAALIPSARATNLLVDGAKEKSSGFTNGSLAPFTICTTLPVNYAVATTLNGQPCAKFTWHEANYDGTRTARGTELCSSLAFQKEGWYGFYIYLPNPGYPMDKSAGVAQWFANNSACNSWAAMMTLRANDLWISHRSNCGTATDTLLYANFPRNRWVSVITHFIVSHLNAGRFEVFIDGVSKYNATGINFGFDTWTTDDALVAPNNIGLKFGQYDYDEANFTPGETRTSYYTNVTQIYGNPTGVFNYIKNPDAIGPILYSAESAAVGGGTVIEAVNTGYHGTGYANFPTTGGTLTFNNVDGGSGGAKTLVIRNALGVAARTGQLVVNGVTTNITFPTTSNWSTWVTQNVAITLNGGATNTIQLKSNGQDFANIDEITVQ